MDQKYIRNFAIIAHVDHGKSTLSDRFLEITNTVEKSKLHEQFLDQSPISRRRGITIKLAPVRMKYNLNGVGYVLNLIDTPGHVDFSYEVSRTLAACEGAILLVDATQGIQAQTVAHLRQARKEKLKIIPAINKIDLESIDIVKVEKEIEELGFKKEEIIKISAKTGQGTEKLLEEIINKIPSPSGNNHPLRALIFDAVYDEYRGVIAYVRVVDGEINKGHKIKLWQNNTDTIATEVGYFSPFLKQSEKLSTGEIGYVVTGIKDLRICRVGDTITTADVKESDVRFHALEGYKVPAPMVFFGMYPKSTDDFLRLCEALSKISLNDTSLTYASEFSSYLGNGFRVGFLGLLHAEIIKERIQNEEKIDILLTKPEVLYEKRGEEFFEPYITITIYTPTRFVGQVIDLCQRKKGTLLDLSYHESYGVLTYGLPYSVFIRNLSKELMSVSSGFASIDYIFSGFKKGNLVNLEIKINDVTIDVLSEFIYKEEALKLAREKTDLLKAVLPRQQFRQVIQGVINGNIVARTEIPPFRKDVLSKMSGGDRTRKDKLLEKQKKGKSRMIATGKINLPQEVFLTILDRN